MILIQPVPRPLTNNVWKWKEGCQMVPDWLTPVWQLSINFGTLRLCCIYNGHTMIQGKMINTFETIKMGENYNMSIKNLFY